MIPALHVIALVACVAVGMPETTTLHGILAFGSHRGMPSSLYPSLPARRETGTHATPIPTDNAFEMVDAVPVSLLIRNDGDEADRLLGGSTPIARQVEVHGARLVAGRREMRANPDGLVIPANATLILEPGGHHLMLFGLQTDLVQGETFPLTLDFAQAGEVTVMARVRRKVDAAGITPFPPVVQDGLSISLVSAPPAPAGTATP